MKDQAYVKLLSFIIGTKDIFTEDMSFIDAIVGNAEMLHTTLPLIMSELKSSYTILENNGNLDEFFTLLYEAYKKNVPIFIFIKTENIEQKFVDLIKSIRYYNRFHYPLTTDNPVMIINPLPDKAHVYMVFQKASDDRQTKMIRSIADSILLIDN